MLTRTLASLLVGLGSLMVLGPQEPVAQDPAGPNKKGRPPFVFRAGTLDLAELVDSCAAYLQWNVLLDEQEITVKGKPIALTVTLQQPVVTDRDGCEELLGNLLWTRGLALVPVDESKAVYEVLSLQGQRRSEVMSRTVKRSPEEILRRPNLRQWVITVHPLEHTNATVATNALRPFFAASGAQQGGGLTLGNVGNQTAMLLSGPQHMVASALEVLRTADVPQPAPEEPGLAELGKQVAGLAARLAAVEEQLARAGK